MDSVTVFVNGKKFVVEKADPELTLIHFLRDQCNLKGTKLGCNEGGCGSCTVMVSRHEAPSNTTLHYAANACLLSLVSLHGHAVTTVEGVGGTKTKIHPVQATLASSHGTQCGFCSPGMVMSMYALLRNHAHPSEEQIEDCLAGNLCRCTGYRPILDGFQSFTSAACPMGEACCKNRKSDNSTSSSDNLASSQCTAVLEGQQDVIFPSELKLKHYLSEEKCYQGERVKWYRPTNIERILELMQQNPQAKIICGNIKTGIGRKSKTTYEDVVISTRHVHDLQVVDDSDSLGLWVGSAITVGELQAVLRDQVAKLPEFQTRLYRALLTDVLKWFGSTQIKNTASLVGNVLMDEGGSDFLPIFIAARVSLRLRSSDGVRVLPINEVFTRGGAILLQRNEIVESVFLPLSQMNEHYQIYKQATRKTMGGAIVNAGLKVVINISQKTISDISLVFGGLEPFNAYSFSKTAKELLTRRWDEVLLEDGVRLLTEELNAIYPSPCEDLVVYKKTLVLSFWYKFYISVVRWLSADKVEPVTHPYLSRSSRQTFDDTDDDSIGDCWKPLAHKAAMLHSTGEAQYVDDLPQYKDELHMALVYSSVAHATVTSIDTTEALSSPGVKGFISRSDVPGNNYWGFIGDEPVFSSEKVLCVGQIIGAVVGDSRHHAQIAARKVQIAYDKLPAILTIEQAIKANSFTDEKATHLWKGDVSKAMAEISAEMIIEGEMKVGGQEHFYMETQVSLCVPKENDEIEMFSSTQAPAGMQLVISKLLSIPSNKITVRVKRVGGGFGGKQSRSYLAALPTAVAAHKFSVPVRCALDRDEDMAITGGRQALYTKYKVGFNKGGQILALDLEVFTNGGCTSDISIAILKKGCLYVDNAYDIPNMRVMGRVCKTNTPTNTACRGLSAPQTMLVMEQILSKISEKLNLPPESIQQLNMYKEGGVTHFGQPLVNCNLEKCYLQALKDSNYTERLETIREFNKDCRWKKRGIAIVPTKYGVSFDIPFLNQAGSLVHVYSDGNVLLTHGGVELGQGLHTKIIQVASTALGISSEKIYLQEVATNLVPNSIVTGASVATDHNAAAVLNACEKLNHRLEPFKKSMPDGSWEKWITAAYFSRVSLSAQGFYSTPDLIAIDWETCTGAPFLYYTYGAAVSEVEIDCLTGDHQVLRTDIVMDVGKSLNPSIDIGQVEGAFIQGYGLFCLEEIKLDGEGHNLTTGPGTYKIPAVGNIPREFNVTLLRDSKNEKAIYSSKAVGEPPLFLAASVFFAIKYAVLSAREDSGKTPDFLFNSPCTAAQIRMSCADRFTDQVLKQY